MPSGSPRRKISLKNHPTRFEREAPMPVYDYICNDCHKTFELVMTLKEHETDIKCPHCKSRNVEQEATAFYAVTGKKS